MILSLSGCCNPETHQKVYFYEKNGTIEFSVVTIVNYREYHVSKVKQHKIDTHRLIFLVIEFLKSRNKGHFRKSSLPLSHFIHEFERLNLQC